MSAYYNEIDPYAVEWLRNLIKAGHIADGEVDTRSIVDVCPDDLRGFDQCHFFAGIAGWSHALRLAGWADDRKIWTGSCPCQPFSVAGKGKGTDDERHLWPHLFRLIRGCRPPVVMGEQVAGAAGYGWLNGVGFDLEGEDYSIEGVDIAACAVNAPHIRQRLYWVATNMADANNNDRRNVSRNKYGSKELNEFGKHGINNDLDNAKSAGLEGRFNNTSQPSIEARNSDIGSAGGDSFFMVNSYSERRQEQCGTISVQTEQSSIECSSSRREGSWESMGSSGNDMANTNSNGCGSAGERRSLDAIHARELHDGMPIAERNTCGINMANADLSGSSRQCEQRWQPEHQKEAEGPGELCAGRSGFWDNAIWLNGADGKARRAKPGVRLLAHGVPARVGKLRAYGNAIVPQIAAEVIKAFMETGESHENT